jgi:hypothetical protein
MKIFIGAIALVLAGPVAAQTVPVGDAHPATEQHQKQGGHADHKMNCKCCEKAGQQGKKMECCAEHSKEATGEHEGHGTD